MQLKLRLGWLSFCFLSSFLVQKISCFTRPKRSLNNPILNTINKGKAKSYTIKIDLPNKPKKAKKIVLILLAPTEIRPKAEQKGMLIDFKTKEEPSKRFSHVIQRIKNRLRMTKKEEHIILTDRKQSLSLISILGEENEKIHPNLRNKVFIICT